MAAWRGERIHKMPMVEQEIHAVLFELNGIWVGFRDALDDFNFRHVHFKAAGRPFIGADHSGDDDARFLCKAAHRLERIRMFFLRNDALD